MISPSNCWLNPHWINKWRQVTVPSLFGVPLLLIIVYMCLYLDLQLVCFSVHSSFCLDLRSFWHFMLTWTWSIWILTDRYLCFFPGYLCLFPGEIRSYVFFKMHKVQIPKVVQLRSFGEKPLKKQKSVKWTFICVSSRMQVYVYMDELEWPHRDVTGMMVRQGIIPNSLLSVIFRFVNYYNLARPMYTYIYVSLCPIIMIVTIMVFPICLTISPYRSHLLHTIIYIYTPTCFCIWDIHDIPRAILVTGHLSGHAPEGLSPSLRAARSHQTRGGALSVAGGRGRRESPGCCWCPPFSWGIVKHIKQCEAPKIAVGL